MSNNSICIIKKQNLLLDIPTHCFLESIKKKSQTAEKCISPYYIRNTLKQSHSILYNVDQIYILTQYAQPT